MGSNLGEAINVGRAELEGIRHTQGKQKVLIFVSDGVPNQPTNISATTGTSSPSAQVQNATGDAWTNPEYAFADSGGEASDAGGRRHRFFNFNFPSIPAGAGIQGILASVDAWSTATSTTASTTLTAQTLGAYDEWSANTGTRITATQTNDGDTTYIDTASSAQTFTFPATALPANALISSVTVAAVARATGSGAALTFVAENGGGLNANTAQALTTSYQTYTRTMASNPLTGSGWTLADVSNAVTRFGVLTQNNPTSVRVTQLYTTVAYSTLQNSGLVSPNSTRNPNTWSNPNRAFTNDGQYATTATNNAQQAFTYGTNGLSIPSTATITGIEVQVEARSSDNNGCELDAELSSNGTAYTATGNNTGVSGSDTVYTLGGNGTLWGRSWTPADFNTQNFAVRLENVDPGQSCTNGSTLSVDYVQTRVYYTLPATALVVSPTAIGGYDQWSTNTSDVASVFSNDGDTSYLHNASKTQTFAPPGAGVPVGSSITSVTLSAVARATGSGATLALVAENGGIPNTGGTTYPLTTTYQTYTRTLTTHPLTGNPWTVSEVNAWATRFGVQTVQGSATPRVTQFTVNVQYVTPPTSSGCQLGMDLSWDGGTTWTSEKTVTLTNRETTYTLGSPTDDWSSTRTWGTGDFTNANFRARVRDIDPGISCADTATTRLDWLRFNVFYTQPTSASTYATNAANTAKASGVNIFSIHYGDASGQNFMGTLASPSTIPSSSITTATRAGTTVTITTSSAHRLTPNQRIITSGISNATLNGTFTVASTPTPTTFTFTTSSSGTINATGGTVAPTNLFISPASNAMSGIFESIGYQICPAAAASCSNGVDDDGDGVADAADGGCHTDGNSGNAASYDPQDTDEWTAPLIPTPPAPPPPPPSITITSWVESP